jgi:hypothetical protein
MHNFGWNALGLLINPIVGSALALSLLISAAPAQTDRLVSGPAPQRTIITTDCEFPTLTVLRTNNTPVNFANTTFLALPGAALTFETFGSRCVKLHFTAKAAASASCFVRAVLNGIAMNPQGGGLQTLVSNDATFNAHAYEWVSRIGEGTHTVVIQRRVSTGTCTIDDWTMDLEVWDEF